MCALIYVVRGLTLIQEAIIKNLNANLFEYKTETRDPKLVQKVIESY